MVNAQIKREYRTMRLQKPFMLVGHDAECSLLAARAVIAFRKLADDGKVRIIAEHDDQEYDWGDIEPTSNDIAMLNRLGVWVVSVEVFKGCDKCGRGEWEYVDSIGGCAGYENPTSEYENCYVSEMMETAVKAVA